MPEKELYRTIYEVAKVINLSLKPKEVMQRIAEQVTSALEAKGCFIRVLDKSGELLLPDAYYGLSDRYADKGPVEVAKSQLDQEVLKGRMLVIPDVRSDARFQYPKQAEEEGLVSLLVLPLSVAGERVIGSIRVYSGEAREFTTDERDFVACIANLAGLALKNARLFSALRRASQLAEDYNYQVFED